MAHLHVLVSFRDSPQNIRCLFKDLSEQELNSMFLAQYRDGRAIMVGGEVVNLIDIHSIQIIKTDRKCEIELKDIQAKSQKENDEYDKQSGAGFLVTLGRGYGDEDIVEAGVDVTSNYVKNPPGSSKNPKPGRASVFLYNPWVLIIVGGLIVAGLVTWLGWK